MHIEFEQLITDRSPWLQKAMGNTEHPDKPDYRDPLSQHHLREAELPRTLMMGTKGMREANRRFLPQMPKESHDVYNARLLRTVLNNQFRKAVQAHASRIFAELVTVKGENIPDGIQEFVKDVDGQGTTLHDFAKSLYEDAKVVGLSYVYIDSPQKTDNETLEDSRRYMPYLVHVTQEDFLGFRAVSFGGKQQVVDFRKMEYDTITDGEFGYKEVRRVRRFLPWNQIIYTEVDSKKKIWSKEVVATDYGTIPLYPYYTQKTGFFKASPPLEDLANLNAAHWESTADQRNILHFSRVPILLLKASSDLDTSISISSAIAVRIGEGDMKYVEHEGKAIEAGRRDLLDLEAAMKESAKEALTAQPGNVTATARILEEVELHSEIQKEAVDLQITLNDILNRVAEVSGWNTEGWTVHVNTEPSLALFSDVKAQALDAMRARGDLSRMTFWERSRQVGVLDRDMDLELEQKRMEEEAQLAPAQPEIQPPSIENATNLLTGNR